MNANELLDHMQQGAYVFAHFVRLPIGSMKPKYAHFIRYPDGRVEKIQSSTLKPLIKRGVVVSEYWSGGKAIYRLSVESFRRGWKEAMTGEVYPIETLWDDMEKDNE